MCVSWKETCYINLRCSCRCRKMVAKRPLANHCGVLGLLQRRDLGHLDHVAPRGKDHHSGNLKDLGFLFSRASRLGISRVFLGILGFLGFSQKFLRFLSFRRVFKGFLGFSRVF